MRPGIRDATELSVRADARSSIVVPTPEAVTIADSSTRYSPTCSFRAWRELLWRLGAEEGTGVVIVCHDERLKGI